jgi:hypothetical protein
MQKALVTSSMFFGLMLAVSVPAMAQNGAVVTDNGVTVTTPNGQIKVNRTDRPATIDFGDCFPDPEDQDPC